MIFGSMFSGIGGLDLGLERAGMECVWQVEMDEYCNKVLEKHWPKVPRHKDVKTFTVDTSANLIYNSLKSEDRGAIDMAVRNAKYDEAVKLYNKGLSVQAVADFYDITRQAMWMILKRRGCEFRDNLRYGKDNHFHRGTQASDKCQNLLETAIQQGIVQRRTDCEKCGSTETFKNGRTAIQAHHPDYNKPLDVMWLCQKCHHEWHKHNKAMPRKEVIEDEAVAKHTVGLICGGFP